MQKFEPDQLVLVRENDTVRWRITHYSHTVEGMDWNVTIDGKAWASQFIIPYSGNEHLLGTTDSPTPKWEPKPGELVAVRSGDGTWYPAIFRNVEKVEKVLWYYVSVPSESDRAFKYCEPFRKHFAISEE